VEINSKKLRALRVSQGKSQPDVEEAAGVPHGRLTQYECGRAKAPIEHVEKLAEYYAVPAKTLISKTGISRLSSTLERIQRILDLENLSATA